MGASPMFRREADCYRGESTGGAPVPPKLLRASALLISMLLCAGCRDIGRGGTGELVIPQQVLRQVEAVDPSQFATTAPTTAPTTLPSTRALRQPPKQVRLGIEDVRRMVLANNLDLKVDLFNPSIAGENLNQEEARFEALFTTSLNYASNDAPFANIINEQLQGTQSQNWSLNPGLQFPLRTGGVLQFSVPMNRLETNSSSATLNPSYSSDFAVSFQQPLLRGGGFDVNAQGIRVAFYGYQTAEAETKLTVIRVLTNAETVYWRLYAARQALEVRKQEYNLAVAQLDRARRQVAAGTVAEVEIVRAQSGVADSVEAIITAENTVHQSERDLKRILNEPELGMESATTIVPSTAPDPLYYQIDSDRLVSRAMNGRMELLETELQIAQATASVRVARHETLPLVSLAYNYGINGLGGDLDQSFTMVRDNNFDNHSVGLQIQVPIGNEAARSRLRQAMLQRLQSLATRAQREQQIRQEVLDACDQLQTDWQRILAARQRVVLNRRLLEVEIRQFEQGLRTSTEVLNAQTDLASAQLSEVSATSDYQIDQINLAQATGVVLGHSHVDWEPVPPPRP
jgi:outer membrane protein TolC